jgi:hypothetical protein
MSPVVYPPYTQGDNTTQPPKTTLAQLRAAVPLDMNRIAEHTAITRPAAVALRATAGEGAPTAHGEMTIHNPSSAFMPLVIRTGLLAPSSRILRPPKCNAVGRKPHSRPVAASLTDDLSAFQRAFARSRASEQEARAPLPVQNPPCAAPCLIQIKGDAHGRGHRYSAPGDWGRPEERERGAQLTRALSPQAAIVQCIA